MIKETINSMEIRQIAELIDTSWPKVNYAARPYLDAMYSLKSHEDNYGAEYGSTIILYFLSNANTWRGEVAKVVKAELKQRIK